MTTTKELAIKATIRKSKKENIEEKNIPAVIYGAGKDNESLWVEYQNFKKVYSEAGENTVISLEIGKKKENVLIYDIQLDPIKDTFIHIDFLRVKMDKEIEADIPLEITGEAPAVKEKGGVLVTNIDHIVVKCKPANLPHEIKIDISSIDNFEKNIKITDLELPKEIEIMSDKNSIIASVVPPRSADELASLDEKVEEDVSKVAGSEEKDKEESTSESK